MGQSKKNKEKKKQKLSAEQKALSLKNRKEIERHHSASADNSLKSLKKIKKQLKKIVEQREREKDQFKSLNQTSQKLSQDLEATEARLSKLALKKDLNKIKNELDKKSTRFQENSDKLTREIILFNDLSKRVDKKIKSLEKDLSPTRRQLESLHQNHDQLFKKINHFEQELSQLDIKLKQPDVAINDFSKQLTSLQNIIAQANHSIEEQDTRINLLKTDSDAIRKSLHQVQDIQQARSKHIDKKLNQIEEHNQKFKNKNKNLNEAIQQLNEKSQLLSQKDDKLDQKHEEHNTLIKRLQTDTGDIHKLLQQVQDIQHSSNKAFDNKLAEFVPKLVKLENQHQQVNDANANFDHRLSTLADAQEQLTAPLESHLSELENNLQSLKDTYNKQQGLLAADKEELNLLNSRIDQFDGLLKGASEELKTHLEHLRESDLKNNSKQFDDFNHKLEELSQKLIQVTELSSELQTQFNELQQQQKSASEHHDELSRQYLSQQQQLDNMDSQLIQFSPLLSDNNEQKLQLESLSTAVEQLSSNQEQLTDNVKRFDAHLNTLKHNLDKSHSQSEKNLSQLQSQQNEQLNQQQEYNRRQQQRQETQNQEQMSLLLDQKNTQMEHSSNLSQLGDQIKTRSQLFGIGLAAVLTVSTLLFFNQELFQDTSNKDALVAQIKTDITNETYRKINVLTKQNSTILNKELKQLRDSIEQVKATSSSGKTEPIDIQSLKKSWHNQYKLLQNDVSGTQAEQQALKEAVAKLTESVDTVSKTVDSLRSASQGSGYQSSGSQSSVPLTSASQKPYSVPTEAPDISKLSDVSEPFYAIQLIGALDKNSIAHFMIRHKLNGETQIYQTDLDDRPWYILLYGHYSHFSQARDQLIQLPNALQKHQPWIRKLP